MQLWARNYCAFVIHLNIDYGLFSQYDQVRCPYIPTLIYIPNLIYIPILIYGVEVRYAVVVNHQTMEIQMGLCRYDLASSQSGKKKKKKKKTNKKQKEKMNVLFCWIGVVAEVGV